MLDLDPRAALVLIDLQNGIPARPVAPRSGQEPRIGPIIWSGTKRHKAA